MSKRSNVFVLAGALAVAMVALLPGVWSSALAQTAGSPTPSATPTPFSTTVAPNQQTTLRTGNGTLMVSPQTFPVTTTFSYEPAVSSEDGLATDEVDEILVDLGITQTLSTQGAFSYVFEIFSMEALDANGNEVQPNGPVTMDIRIPPNALGSLRSTTYSLKFFDEDTQQWTAVPCTLNQRPNAIDAGSMTCELPHFSVWAIVAEQAAEGTGVVPSPADTGMGLQTTAEGSSTVWLVGAFVAVAALSGAGARYAVRRTRR